MKTWKRALALVLALVMALSLVALPSFAEGEEESAGNGSPRVVYEGESGKNNGGLVMSKTIKKTGDSQFLLTLEAFATGTTTTTTTKDPVDIVLVLDVSGSMDDYMETYSVSPAAPIIVRIPMATSSGCTTVVVVEDGLQGNMDISTTAHG